MRRDFKTFMGYLGVGGSGAVAYVVIASGLSQLGMRPWAAGAITYAALIPCVYVAQRRFAFSSDAPHRSAFPRYLTLQGLGFCLAWLLPLLLDGVLPTPIIFLSTAGSVAVVNFFLMKFWAFAPLQK